ncbi:MAG: YhbD family protein [Coriobacteriales bacterium]|nr:YhbD family protein [Coriobacteriales bacterium]
MDTELISKKELLQEAGISYGQLYRWKRKGLIPEDWFVRKSTFTGQETFFPRAKMLARVERILGMKNEDLSLDDIADAVSPSLADVSLTLAEIRQRGLFSEAAVDAFVSAHPGEEALPFGGLLSLCVLDSMLRTGEVSLEEGQIVLDALDSGLAQFENKEADVLFVRKMGLSTALLVPSSAPVAIESGARVVTRLGVSECSEALSARIR